MEIDRQATEPATADVWTWMVAGCNQHEIATYLGVHPGAAVALMNKAATEFCRREDRKPVSLGVAR